MIGFLSFFIVFSLLVLVHELGHFAVAKLFGVAVEEFGLGYPPRLLVLGRWKGTVFTLNALPFGGFVRMGEDDLTVPNSLASKGRLVRALVYTAGALMNLLLAVVLYSAIFATGALTPVQGRGAGVYYVAPGSPAEEAGILPGDTLVAIEGTEIQDVDHAVRLIQERLGEPIEILLRRNGELLPPIVATPRLNPPPNEGALGVALDLPLERKAYPVWQAVPLGVRATWLTIQGMVQAVRLAIAGQMPFQVTGPVGIYHHTVEVAKTGLEPLTEFVALISVNLFLLNLLPLPALDGGRLLFVILEWVRRGRRIPPEKEGLVHLIGFAVLLALMLLVTYADIRRLAE